MKTLRLHPASFRRLIAVAFCTSLFGFPHERAFAQTNVTSDGANAPDNKTGSDPVVRNEPWALSEADGMSMQDEGTGTAVLTEDRQHVLQSSFVAGYGYDTAINDVPHVAAPFTLTEGVFGLSIKRRRYSLLLQHDGRIACYLTQGCSVQQFQQTTLSMGGYFSRRTRWSAQLGNGYGTDTALALGDEVVTVTSPIGAAQPAGTLPLGEGTTLTDYGSFSLQHRLSRSVTMEGSAGEYVHHFFDYGTTGQEQNAHLSLVRTFAPSITAGILASGVRESYGDSRCVTGTVSAIASITLTRSLRFEGSAGPSMKSAGCSGDFVVDSLLSGQLGRYTSVYAGAARKPSDQFAAGANWETSAFAGVIAGNARGIQSRSEFGYSSYSVATPTVTTPNTSGFYVSQELRHRLAPNAEVSLVGRYFDQTAVTSKLNRAILLLTVSWSQEQRPHRTSFIGGNHGDR